MPSLSIFVQDSVHRHPQSTALSPHTLYVVMDLLLEIQVIPDPRGGDGSDNNTDNMLHGDQQHYCSNLQPGAILRLRALQNTNVLQIKQQIKGRTNVIQTVQIHLRWKQQELLDDTLLLSSAEIEHKSVMEVWYDSGYILLDIYEALLGHVATIPVYPTTEKKWKVGETRTKDECNYSIASSFEPRTGFVLDWTTIARKPFPTVALQLLRCYTSPGCQRPPRLSVVDERSPKPNIAASPLSS